MNPKILALLSTYDEVLRGLTRFVAVVQTVDRVEYLPDALVHARWMIAQMGERVVFEGWSDRKTNRWLGFIQGVLFAQGHRGILAMRDDSRDLYPSPELPRAFPIRSEADLTRAFAVIDALWGAPENTPEADVLDVIVTLVQVYEAKHHPLNPSPRPSRPRGTAVSES